MADPFSSESPARHGRKSRVGGRGDSAAEPKAPPRRLGASRRDPERTKERILRAAMKEFSTKGLAGARMDEIAERADINKRMLYHYFGSKEELFVAVLEEAYAHIRRSEAYLGLTELEPVEGMRRLVTMTFEYFRDNPDFIRLLNTENLYEACHIQGSARVQAINHTVIGALGDLLDRGQKAGVFRAGVDPVQLYITIAGVSYLYFSNVHTLSVAFSSDLLAPDSLKTRLGHATDVVLGYLRP